MTLLGTVRCDNGAEIRVERLDPSPDVQLSVLNGPAIIRYPQAGQLERIMRDARERPGRNYSLPKIPPAPPADRNRRRRGSARR